MLARWSDSGTHRSTASHVCPFGPGPLQAEENAFLYFPPCPARVGTGANLVSRRPSNEIHPSSEIIATQVSRPKKKPKRAATTPSQPVDSPAYVPAKTRQSQSQFLPRFDPDGVSAALLRRFSTSKVCSCPKLPRCRCRTSHTSIIIRRYPNLVTLA